MERIFERGGALREPSGQDTHEGARRPDWEWSRLGPLEPSSAFRSLMYLGGGAPGFRLITRRSPLAA